MTLRLLVKGDTFTASRAALERGLSFTAVRQDNGETVLRADDKHLDVVEAWFIEPPNVPPYPLGALLAYSWEGLDGNIPARSKPQ
jgi:hypothetical protein